LRKNITTIICILIIILSIILSGCSGTNTEQIEKSAGSEILHDKENTPSTMDINLGEREFKEISVDEAYKIFISDKNYLFIDVRSKEEYDENHVRGAILIPMTEIRDSLNEIPQDKILIIYCNGTSCERSSISAEILVENGFTQVYRMGGLGILEWIEKNYPVE